MTPREHWLVWRLRRGDREAARELVGAHHRAVYGYLLRRCSDAALAEDLSQETFSRAWSAISRLRRAESLRSWLLAIARNEHLQLARRRICETTPMDGTPDPADPSPDPLAALTESRRDEGLRAAVGRLDPELRETVALHYFHELSLREVGAVLGVPAGTVKSRLNRALGTLRSALERQEANHEGPNAGQEAAGTF